MLKLLTINRRGWVATWLQSRRRARVLASAAPAPPATPPTPVITGFTVADENGELQASVTWSWNGQGWPEASPAQFYLYIEDDSGQQPVSVYTVLIPATGRTAFLTGYAPANDTNYTLNIRYQKSGHFSGWATAQANPY